MPRWVPRPVDLAVAAALTVAAQVEIWAGFVPIASGQRWVLAASYLVGTVAVAWHRTAPLTALVITLAGLGLVSALLDVDSQEGLTWFVAVFGVIVSVGYHARRPLVGLAVTLGVLLLIMVMQKGVVLLGDIAYAWLLAGGAWLAGWAVRSRTVRADLSEQRATLAEHEAQWRADAAVAEERLRIARELHDVISHGLSVMTLHVGGVRRLLGPDQLREREALEAVERTGRESLAEMHRMLGVLRGPDTVEAAVTPGLADVHALLDSARAAGLDVGFAVAGDVRPLPPGIDLAAYRIVQEGVTNVLRHAHAGHLDVRTSYGPAELQLFVTDDGTGGNGGVSGHGLIGMRERAALYGGTVEAGPRSGGGFAVRAVLPVPAAVPVAREAP